VNQVNKGVRKLAIRSAAPRARSDLLQFPLFSTKMHSLSCHFGVRKVASSRSNLDLASSALTLVSIPVSGYAMRVRYIVAKKGLGPDVFQTRPPADFGGLKSA
jgi:hypothetical protein